MTTEWHGAAMAAEDTRFYLGTHMPNWLERLDVPLFVARNRLAKRATLPVARGRWALDSNGFTQLHKHGGWTIPVDRYAEDCQRFAAEIGGLDWVAPQDWMCEPGARKATGLTVADHQARTLENFLELRALLGPLVIPVLQGWEVGDHAAHRQAYEDAGVDLASEATVGVGSVCRKHSDAAIRAVLVSVQLTNLHGFGLRGQAIFENRDVLTSADSLAWSYNARKHQAMLGCRHGRSGHGKCGNCPRWALRWRQEHVVDRLAQPRLWPPLSTAPDEEASE